MADYDFVVLTPWGSIPLVLESADRSGPRRTFDPWIQFKGSAMIAGLAHQFVEPARIEQIAPDAGDAQARLDIVLAAIRGGSGGQRFIGAIDGARPTAETVSDSAASKNRYAT